MIAGQGDETFLPLVAGEVAAMAVQPDGRVVIGGDFAQVGGQARSRIVGRRRPPP